MREALFKEPLCLLWLRIPGSHSSRALVLGRKPDQLSSPPLVLLLGHHPEHFECHLSLVSWYLAQRKAQDKQLLQESRQQLHTHLQSSCWFHPKDLIIYHVPSLENPEESKVLIGLVESSCLSGFWRHIQCLPPFLAELLQIGPLQFPDPCLLACGDKRQHWLLIPGNHWFLLPQQLGSPVQLDTPCTGYQYSRVSTESVCSDT